jgi:predicted LPLAT superfamily acyltransferase/glycosyltransferase involved in cell wall biosynthesis
MSFRVCAIIPSYNHHQVVGDVVATLHGLGLPVFVVDDGSDAAAAATLAAMDDRARGIRVTRLPVNCGKGRAVCEGFRLAREAGFTHSLQVDADGQHDLAVVPRMLDLAERHPDALVSGHALFDRSAPIGRRIGRWITHLWVFVETLSFRVTDSMCGLRVYPLAVVADVLDSEPVGSRMDFDTSVMVRLCWRGVPVVMVPVRISYPPDNTSNFRLWRDNLYITWMHTRLVLTMLARAVRGRIRRPRRPDDPAAHWASLTEVGVYCGIRFCVVVYRLIGRCGCLAIIAPIVAYCYLTAGDQRRASQRFLQRAFALGGLGRRPNSFDGLRHFMRFADRILDSFIAWTGGMHPDAVAAADPVALAAFTRDPRGGVLIVGHLGNTDVSRALLDPDTRARLLILTHTNHAANYNRVLREVSPDAAVNMLQVTDIGPDMAISLRDHVDRGGWIVIAGDRTPVRSRGRVAHVPFLGALAPFSQGPYLLAALMECPVWLLFCTKAGRHYRLVVERFAERIVLPRGRRAEALAGHAARYAMRLQAHAMADPFQWYNFFDFWVG